MVLGTPTTLTPSPYSLVATDRDQGVHAQASQVVLDPLHSGHTGTAGVRAQRVGPRGPEDRPAPGQDPAYGLDVERDSVPLQGPAPAVAEPDELESVLLDALADDGTDNGIEAGAVPASGQHSHSHEGNTSAHECPRD